MDIEAARRMAEEILAQHPTLAGWRITFSTRARRTLGLCRHRRRQIQLSVAFLELNGEAEIRNTVLHEICHALLGPGKGHGVEWQAQCIVVGASPDRLNYTAILPPGDFVATCPNCQRTFSRYRQVLRRYWCRQCGPFRGPLTFARRQEGRA